MDATEVSGGAFWDEARPRVLASPHRAEEGQGLEEILRGDGEARGWVVFATSGSTGGAKWVALRREALRASARAVNAHLEVSSEDRWLLALPVYHVGGFGVVARAVEAGCSWEEFPGKWDAAAFQAMAAGAGTTLTSLVPAQVHDLVAAGLRAPESLRAVVVGGGGLAETTGQRARDLGWPVLPSFGMTEAGSQVATAPLAALTQAFAPAPIPLLGNWEAKTSDEGVLQLRGDALFDAYLGVADGAVARDDPKADGWFTSGDRVEMTEGGITPLGRVDRLVKVLGELVDLGDLEARLAERWDRGVCVVPFEDERRGFLLVPVFEGRGDAEETVTACNEALPGYAQLGAPRFLDPWPRTAVGKTDYAGIVEKVVAGGSS